MSSHPAIIAGNLAVITGAGYGGIGYAIARLLTSPAHGMSVLLADISAASLEASEAALIAGGVSKDSIHTQQTDVSKYAEMERLVEVAYKFGQGKVDVLVLNAGVSVATKDWNAVEGGAVELARWQTILDVNFYGVLHGTQAFTSKMVAQKTAAAIVVVGSKQGITCPPGNPAYNVSKAAVKSLTESLAHSLLDESVTAHLLVPGYTFTKLTSQGASAAADAVKPAAAWSGDQVAAELLSRMKDEFIILCPDNDVSEALDMARIEWSVGDILHKRPALSRWHPDYAHAFAQHLKSKHLL